MDVEWTEAFSWIRFDFS
uniref:Uncharacterized protein n=1 Tax=Arundo donax TaxID=35708 RepID=A0A0A9FQT5_ARUDO